MERRIFLHSLILGSGYLMIKPFNTEIMKLKGKDIHITMIYNNTGEHDKLQPAWGLSVWI